MCVRVLLSEKDMGQVDDYNTTVFFFTFIDWRTGINKESTPVSFSLSLVKFPSFFLHLSDFSFHFVVQLLSFCILHLSWAVFSGSVMKWRQVTPPKKDIQDHGKKTPYCVLPHHAAFRLPLPQHAFKHVWVSMHMHMCSRAHMRAHTHARTFMWLLHTSFNTYRCRALWFS